MIRECTHCKKADTESLEKKYCLPCMRKFLNWLKRNEKTEPPSVIPTKADRRASQNFFNDVAKKIYKGSK